LKKSEPFKGVLLTIVIAMALLALCVAAGSQTSAANKKSETGGGNVEKGKELYTSDGCYECHGRQGQGSRTSGPRLAPNPIPLAAFSNYVREPRGQMPPYTSKVVSEADLADIYAFLKTIPQPPSVKEIPLLQ
jgi:ubiquinol-cytochrome c reductase cytochrome c subunit